MTEFKFIWQLKESQIYSAYHFLSTIFSHLVPVCAATSFLRSPIVSSGLGASKGKHMAQNKMQDTRCPLAKVTLNFWSVCIRRILALDSDFLS